ncbi:MAG: xanthine dehydrogenase family protein [Candidatus Eisenbacteria sp.]|nr:xanthine dehydrogenase family protein [Candidatus Eisenbacteria bacterium]
MWFGGTARSPVAHGYIKAIHRDPAFDWSQVVVVTAADLPGPNAVRMIRDDHPILAADEVCFVSEPVAIIAAPDRDTLIKAIDALSVEIEEHSPILTMEDSLRAEGIVWGDDNIFAEYRIHSGDPAAGFRSADLIVEGTYRTGHQEHLYLEPNGVIAIPRSDGGIELLGSMQCPYYVHAALAHGLGLESTRIVVKQTTTGGAFGGKEDFPSVLALHASLLAQRAGCAVKMVHERTEDIRSTTKRHPSRIHHRTGVMRDGKLVASEIDLLLDGGAYTTLSPVVLSRATLHATGAYYIPNVSIRGRVVATHTPPNGAFRGFGAPQSLFAVERHVDRIARELGIDPLDIRRRNMLRDGDQFPFGQVLKEGVGASLVLEQAIALSEYKEKKASKAWRCGPDPHRAGEKAEQAEKASGAQPSAQRTSSAVRSVRKGVGLSLYLHGGGFTGAGEERISAKAQVRFVSEAQVEGSFIGSSQVERASVADDQIERGQSRQGHIEVLVSNVEMGQGASTVLPMIAAQALGLPLELFSHPHPDTSRVPDSGPTVASRTTMMVGRIVIDACSDMVAKLKAALAQWHEVRPEEVELANGRFVACGEELGSFTSCASRFSREMGPLLGEATYVPPAGLRWDEETYRGDAYKAYSWGAHVVEVEVDMETLEVRPVKVTAVVEIGRAINPVLAVGQVDGGTLQALGWGGMEEIKLEGGRYLNDRVTTYIIPTALDAPDIEVKIVELPYERGPYGAKGLGELPMNGGAPALVSAIEDATGLSASAIPVTPERLMALMDEGSEIRKSKAGASNPYLAAGDADCGAVEDAGETP